MVKVKRVFLLGIRGEKFNCKCRITFGKVVGKNIYATKSWSKISL